MDEKTNVMRILDKKKIKYNHYCYTNTDAISGLDVATVLNQNPSQVFKTLVTIGKSKKYYVIVWAGRKTWVHQQMGRSPINTT